MQRYKLSNEAKMDLARIYWHGVREFGVPQKSSTPRLRDIHQRPHREPLVTCYAITDCRIYLFGYKTTDDPQRPKETSIDTTSHETGL